MSNRNNDGQFKRKWWLHPMDPENIAGLSDRDRRNAKRYNQWLFIWGVMFFGAIHALDPLPGGISATPVWRVLLAFSPIIPGIFLIRAFIRLFGETKEELIRKIHIESLAVGFLCAFVIGMCFALSAIIVGESVVAGPVMFVGLLAGYFVSLTLKYRKYNA